jgi:ElaB/YqjD/DUF883 family membrane-anchored ribosome-binding protein
MARTQTATPVEKTTADLEKQIATLKADVASLTSTLSDYGQAQKHQLGEAASETMDIARQKGIEAAEQARQQTRDAIATAERTVRSNPSASVGVAAAVGFVAGILATRR